MEEVRGSNPLSSTASISRPGGTFAPWPVFVGVVSGRDLGQSLASHQFGSRLPAQTPRVAHGLTVPRAGEFLPAACRIRSEAFVAGVRGSRRQAAGTRSDEMPKYLISF